MRTFDNDREVKEFLYFNIPMFVLKTCRGGRLVILNQPASAQYMRGMGIEEDDCELQGALNNDFTNRSAKPIATEINDCK